MDNRMTVTGMDKSDEFEVPKRRSEYNWAGLIIALATVGMCLLFVLPAALSGNPFFAFGRINRRPIQAIVYYEGEALVFTPDDPEYDRLVEACYTALAHEIGFAEWGWSEQRFEQARTEGIAVELIYDRPVKLPGSRLDIADPTRLFFPLEVFGHEGEVVFRGGSHEYWGRPIRVDTLDPVREAVQQITGGGG